MAASLLRSECATLGLLGRLGREGLQERHVGNGASCPATSSGALKPTQRQFSGGRLRKVVGLFEDGLGGRGDTTGWCKKNAAGRQVWPKAGWQWSRLGSQRSTSCIMVHCKGSASLPMPMRTTSAMTLQEVLRTPLSWCASAAALLIGRPTSESRPTASQCLAALLVAVAASCIVAALVASRLPPLLLMAMGLVGDFGEIGPRRRNPSLRPAIKKQKAIEMEGEVQKALPNAMFQVALDNGCQVLAHISGKIRRSRIEIFQGDRVKVEISPYDLTRGRITHRNRRAGQGPAPGAPPVAGGAPAPASS